MAGHSKWANIKHRKAGQDARRGYGPNGVAILVETMTDNRNRTVSEVRHCFTKAGGNLGTSGSVSYLFNRTGVITYAAGVDEDKLLEAALEAGADDLEPDADGSVQVRTSFENFGKVRDALDGAGFEAAEAEVTMLASNEVELDVETAEKLLKLVENLEDLDDVQNVYSNASIADEVMEQLQANQAG